jgi:YVTN family beta-propeller protein
MAMTRGGNELWVTSRWINQVTVVDLATKQIIHRIPVGRSPHGIYLDERAPHP